MGARKKNVPMRAFLYNFSMHVTCASMVEEIIPYDEIEKRFAGLVLQWQSSTPRTQKMLWM